MEKIIQVLKKNPGIDDWIVTYREKKSTELFYIADRLETTRETDTAAYNTTVYVDKDGRRGTAEFTCYDYMTEEEIAQKAEEAVYAASFALNDAYGLPFEKAESIPESSSNLKGRNFREVMDAVVEAVFRADCGEQGYLSATEFFLYETKEHLVNSRGVDVSMTRYEGNIELIPSWGRDENEVETYYMLKFETLDPEDITRQVEEQMALAKARYEAKALELKEPVKVIFQDEEAAAIFWYYAQEAGYLPKYNKTARYGIGDFVQGENLQGDPLNLKLVPYYPGAIDSRYFDGAGTVLSEVSVIENGIVKALHGSYRFGCMIGEKKPTGNLPVAVVKEGTKSLSQMQETPYLRCVKFSDMQIERNSGYFGGEVRLGFYFDGEKEIPVTGFAVSGNIRELGGKMVYSTETVTLENYHGPRYLEIPGMEIE